MAKKTGFGKIINKTNNENREKYYQQMLKDLPIPLKEDLGHAIFRLAGESKVVISPNPAIADILASLLRSIQDKNGRVCISKPLLIGKYGVIGGSDFILKVNGKIGTFDISDTNLCKFAFEKHCVFIGYADVNKRFCRKSQWVIPVKVIRCYLQMN